MAFQVTLAGGAEFPRPVRSPALLAAAFATTITEALTQIPHCFAESYDAMPLWRKILDWMY